MLKWKRLFKKLVFQSIGKYTTYADVPIVLTCIKNLIYIYILILYTFSVEIYLWSSGKPNKSEIEAF